MVLVQVLVRVTIQVGDPLSELNLPADLIFLVEFRFKVQVGSGPLLSSKLQLTLVPHFASRVAPVQQKPRATIEEIQCSAALLSINHLSAQ